MPDTPRGDGRIVLLAASALAACCTVHVLLLAGGLAGIGAVLGAATANIALPVAASVVLAVLAGVVIARLRRRGAGRRRPQPRANPTRVRSDHPR